MLTWRMILVVTLVLAAGLRADGATGNAQADTQDKSAPAPCLRADDTPCSPDDTTENAQAHKKKKSAPAPGSRGDDTKGNAQADKQDKSAAAPGLGGADAKGNAQADKQDKSAAAPGLRGDDTKGNAQDKQDKYAAAPGLRGDGTTGNSQANQQDRSAAAPCLRPDDTPCSPDDTTENAQANKSPAILPATPDPYYLIGPLDVLSINVWKETELSVIVPVRPDGKISLPLLNDVDAGGMTPMALTALLTEKLKKYFADPRVAVTVKEINSKRVYILGQVTRPGAYSLTPQMTVMQALSTAGGFGQYAGLKNIYVLRIQDGKQVKLPFNYKEFLKGKNTDQNFFLLPEDTIVVP